MIKKKLLLCVLLVQSILCFSQNYDYKIISLPTNDMVVAPLQKRIYASVPSSVPNYGNSICRINPNFATIESSIWVGSEPNKLALSDDEKYLYIGFKSTSKVKRLNLLTGQIEQEVDFLSNNGDAFFGYLAGDIAVMPKHPNTYIVARQNPNSFPSYAGVVAMDNTTKRTTILEGYNESNHLLFTSDTTFIWGIGDEGTWYKLRIDTAGITKSATYTPLAGYAQNLHYSKYDSLYYASDGFRYDLRGGTPVGKQFASAPGYSLADVLNPNIYYLNAYNDIVEFKIYNRKTQVPIDQFTLSITLGYVYKAVNWGTSGQFALSGFDKIVIINSCQSTASKPVITEGGSISICSNAPATLTASGNATKYYWSTGYTTKSISLRKGGTYSVGVADATGCVNYSDPTTVSLINPTLPPSISLVNYNDALCIGSVAKLATGYLGDNNKYEWSNGKTGQTIDVTQSIELTVVAVSPQGCRSAPSSPYKVPFINRSKPPKPSIKIVGDTAFCAYLGKKVNLNATAGYATYKWSTGQTTQNITTITDYTTKFSVSVTDEFGCQSPSSDTVTIRVKDSPYKPSINKNGNILSVYYTTGIQWFLNGVALVGANNQTYTVTANGFYTVQITSAEACVSEISNWVNITSFSTAVNNLEKGQKFDVFPNPIQDILTVYTEGVVHSTISITDAYGRTVLTMALQEKAMTISTTNLPSGMYAISLFNAQGRILSIKKIIKL